MGIEQTEERIVSGDATVGVVGQGYVGLSVAAAAATAGMTVVGLDRDAERVTALSHGDLVVPGVRPDEYDQAMATGRLTFSTDAADLAGLDVVLLCVPTPVHEHRPDLSMVESAATAVADHLQPGTLVILESTTYAGTTEELVRPILEKGGLTAGTDFLLAYSPERIDPGNTDFGFRDTPRVVGGLDETSTRAAAAFYGHLVDRVHPVSSCRAAELAKLLENTYRMVNIALVNELAMLCAAQGIETWEVIDAAASKPFGFAPFYPGPGVGGHCIPIDPTYLSWQSRRDTGKPYRLVELAQDINAEMPAYVASRIADALNDRERAVKGSRILALGVTYKPDVGDVRESAPLLVLERLAARGARISFHDPFVEEITVGGETLHRVELDDEQLRQADCVALLTPHASYDLPHLAASAGLLFDARNATRERTETIVVL